MKQNNIDEFSRRKFLKKGALSMFATLLGTPIVFGNNLPAGLIPIGLDSDPKKIPGKSDQLSILNDRPWNAETPAHLLDHKVTPSELMFVRNNGLAPRNIDPQKWTLAVEGEAAKTKKKYSLQDLKTKFKT